MTTTEEKVLAAFKNGMYAHKLRSDTLEPIYEDYIDGMGQVGLLWGAAGDTTELRSESEWWINELNGDEPFRYRKFERLPPEYETIRTGKPQSLAGPFALIFAKRRGRYVPWDMGKYETWARVLSSWPVTFLFGLVAGIPYFTQHINTVFLACLATGRKPAFTMKWLWEGNPFYSYIAGEKCTAEYPRLHRTTQGHAERRKEPVPFNKRKPSSWPFRGHPHDEYVPDGDEITGEEYTPIWELVATILQGELA